MNAKIFFAIFFLKSSQKLFSYFEVFECQKNLLKYLLITDVKMYSPIFKVPWGVTATCPWVVAGKRIPGLDSLIQNKVGVGFPAAMQSSDAGAPSATFWFDGSTKKIGGAETKKNHAKSYFPQTLSVLRWMVKLFFLYQKSCKKTREIFMWLFPKVWHLSELREGEHKFYICHIPGRSYNLQPDCGTS